MQRRSFLHTSAALLGSMGFAPLAGAQSTFPEKPVRFTISSAAGGVTDAVARLYGEHMAKSLKQPVVPENVPGAGTLLSIRQVLRSPADGYMLGVMANTVVTMPFVDKDAGYQPNDFTGISYLAKSHMVLVVSGDSPYKTLAEVVAAAAKAPDTISYASVGIGTTSHIPVELFAQAAKLKLLMVPYKGIALATPDVLSGRVTMMMGTGGSVGDMLKAGKMRALAVTSETRSAMFPGVPTFVEQGYPDVTYELFLGLMAPARTPPAVRKVLADAAEQAKQDPQVRARLAAIGQELPSQNTPELFNAFLQREQDKMKALTKTAHIQTGR